MKTQRFAVAALVVLAVAAAAKKVVEESDLYKGPPSLEEEIRGLKVAH